MSFSVQEILDFTGGRIVNSSWVGPLIQSVSVEKPVSLKGSQPSEVAFFFSRAFEQELPFANPGVLVIGEAFVSGLQGASHALPFWKTAVVVACQDPYSAMAVLSEKFASVLSPGAHLPSDSNAPLDLAEIHPSSVVHSTVALGAGVKVGPHCVIEANVRLGTGCVLYSGCSIGESSILGDHCVAFPRVVIYDHVTIGARARLHAGAVIGADGFGYAPKMKDHQVVGHQKIYHLGGVTIGDDVEVGANSAIDRGTFGQTRIGNQIKIDNLVHIGHNALLDEGAIICGGACLAGHARVGKYAYVGGLTGIANHVDIGDRARVGALTLVTKDVPVGGTAVGNPHREYQEHFRTHALLNRLLAERRKK